MKYEEIIEKLEQGNLKDYIYRHYRKIFSDIKSVIEQVPGDKINEILENGDSIKYIVVLRRFVDVKACFQVRFASALTETDYDVYVPIPEENPEFLSDVNQDRVDILVAEHALEIYSETLGILSRDNSEEVLKEVLGDDYIRSTDQSITLKNSFFD